MKKKISVGILSFYYPHLGGSGIMATRIARELSKDGHDVHFIGYDTDEQPRQMEELGIHLHRVGRINYPCLKNEPYVWTIATKICDVADRYGLDIVHVHYALPHALCAYVAKGQLASEGRSLPFVVTGHGSDIHTNGHKKDVNRIFRFVLNNADGLSYVSKDLQRIAEDELGIMRKGVVITNFLDTKKFYRENITLRERWKIPPDAFVVGHASNFAPIKQTGHFSKVARVLREEGLMEGIYFVFAGTGSEQKRLQKEIHDLELEDRCRFVGKLDDDGMRLFYSSIDAFVLPSQREGCPLTLLEAMACEVPVISTTSGGLPELVDGNNGYLFESGDITGLADRLLMLKSNPLLRMKMGMNGRKRVEKSHDVSVVMDQYYALYDEALGSANEIKRCVCAGTTRSF